MTLAKKLETALLAIIRENVPDIDSGGLRHNAGPGFDHHYFLDPAWIVHDEIDLTQLSTLLADAVTVMVDPAETNEASVLIEPAKGED